MARHQQNEWQREGPPKSASKFSESPCQSYLNLTFRRAFRSALGAHIAVYFVDDEDGYLMSCRDQVRYGKKHRSHHYVRLPPGGPFTPFYILVLVL